MKTNVSRKTINTYIYLKKNHVINNRSAEKSILKATVVFLYILFHY